MGINLKLNAKVSIAFFVGAEYRGSGAKNRLNTPSDFARGGRQWGRIEEDFAWASFQLQF
jgi:hypothetical protein